MEDFGLPQGVGQPEVPAKDPVVFNIMAKMTAIKACQRAQLSHACRLMSTDGVLDCEVGNNANPCTARQGAIVTGQVFAELDTAGVFDTWSAPVTAFVCLDRNNAVIHQAEREPCLI